LHLDQTRWPRLNRERDDHSDAIVCGIMCGLLLCDGDHRAADSVAVEYCVTGDHRFNQRGLTGLDH
jgi:hypothetical protein